MPRPGRSPAAVSADKNLTPMRICFAGAGHWHTRLYLQPAMELADVEIVGIEDRDITQAKRWADTCGCRAYSDLDSMCESERPDFVFALGRHVDMSNSGQYLANAGIPFALEKPCGSSRAEILALARAIDRTGVFAAVPFVYRYSPLLDLLKDEINGGKIARASLRYISGPVSRYIEAGCEWMLDRRQAGGGSTANLGVHFLDLIRTLWPGDEWHVRASDMRTTVHGDIEDYSVVVLRSSSGNTAVIESGYTEPGPTGPLDVSLCVDTGRSYVQCQMAESVSVRNADGRTTFHQLPTDQNPFYPQFVLDTLERARNGTPPIADVADMAAVADLLDAAYRRAERVFGSG